MKITKLLFAIAFFVVLVASAQEKAFTLEEIWKGAFSTEGLQSLHSMKSGKEYSVIERDAVSGAINIEVYNYESGEKTKTLVTSSSLGDLSTFQGYSFSKDENRILLSSQLEQIYRHSSRGIYHVYDVLSKGIFKVSDKKIQEPLLSPDGNKIAYVLDNNIYMLNFATGQEVQLTDDGKKNEIINGITDWVYEEEFAFVRAFDWSADSKKIAFLRFDEREVPEFSMDVYGKDLYPKQEVFKYPKAGEKNAKVSLYVADITEMTLDEIKLGDYKDFYIPRIKWTASPDVLSVQVLNRHQNSLDLIFVDAKTKTPTVVLNEKDNAYIDITDNLTFLDDNSFIWTSEKDGFNHIYHYTTTGELINQITKGAWEITNYYGYDKKNKKIYYQSVENGSINRDIYSITLDGKDKKRLSNKEGINDADFSADFSFYINYFSNSTTPYEYTLNKGNTGVIVREIKNNKGLLEKLKQYNVRPKEFSTIEINGETLNTWMIKPKDFDSAKKYPLLMFQYSGPGSQMVKNSWHSANDYWYMMLAQQGYIVVCVDGKGTGLKGAKFKKATQNDLGNLEVQDQVAAAKHFGALEYIDASRIGIWGWSYGGFMSSNCLFKAPDVFKMAIAVAPVTNWRFYDTVYTERYLMTPQENTKGYDDNSPINFVNGLKGKFLLIHGSADDNVHVQNTMQLVEALIQANKDFDWAIYPDKNHGIYGGNTRLHLYNKMTNFITNNL
ncbi:S9 family peptidase [Aquimarina muelleri]|uniref:Peptidase S9 n=1 Tax=Aquimarina muelleri TaxID=279356 RepID=A0A918N3S5_9FLAO|nr:S9 family peptidase [Aquimarina muelleri]MCX2762421.1 S9 family peptidase [Aquimarina muelleri]GGX24657.1 peptidase S9 [Aquimarina muelleri]